MKENNNDTIAAFPRPGVRFTTVSIFEASSVLSLTSPLPFSSLQNPSSELCFLFLLVFFIVLPHANVSFGYMYVSELYINGTLPWVSLCGLLFCSVWCSRGHPRGCVRLRFVSARLCTVPTARRDCRLFIHSLKIQALVCFLVL